MVLSFTKTNIMKQFIFFISVGLACTSMSCTDKSGGVDSATQKNLDAAHGINKAIESGDMNKLGDYIATDAVDHGDHGDVKGLDSIKAELAMMHTMSTDMKSETTKELADKDYVFQWMHFTGTASTAGMGMPPGTKYDMTSIEVSRFQDGKSVEHWEYMEPREMMKMMANMPKGAAPQMNATMPAAKDSTSK